MKEKNKKKDHLFKGTGMGVTHKQPPVCVKLPPEIDKIVRSLPNRSEYIRQAIIEKLDREGLLTSSGVN